MFYKKFHITEDSQKKAVAKLITDTVGQFYVLMMDEESYKNTQKRSVPQNNKMWTIFSKVQQAYVLAHGQYLKLESIHDFFCELFLPPPKTIQTAFGSMKERVQTSKLSKHEMSEFLDKIIIYISTEMTNYDIDINELKQ